MALVHIVTSHWMAQRGHLFPWIPVCLAVGIGLFFALRFEPAPLQYFWIGILGLSAAFCAIMLPFAWRPFGWAIVLISAGFMLAGTRTHTLAEPVLGWRYYGPVEGRIVGIDRSSSDAVRLTLDTVRLRDVSPARTPHRVRLSLHGPQDHITPKPGLWVMSTAHLSPPAGPVEPGGFDFQRHAWFLQLGAMGYTRNPVLIRAPPDGSQPVFAARMALSDHVRQVLPGEAGAFAAAIMTGDRSGIGQDTLRDLRVSNLAHLLAISGLHMGLLAGFVFAALRYGFALVPYLCLRVSSKKLAAVIALVTAAGYLALSGGNVATERAFVMVAVALVAVLLDRQVFSLRAVAVAAIIVLCLRPEALLGPGFQMSFAATTALVAVFGWLRETSLPRGPRWASAIFAVFVSSAVAGLATAPVAAAHFNQIAHYGLVANLTTVPLMGILVMPAAVLGAVLLPFGLEWIPLWVMGQGVAWILFVADWVTALEGARGVVVSPELWVLPCIGLGALCVFLWQGRARWGGVLPIVAAFWMWSATERPDVLIAENGGLVGVMTPEGRALSRGKGNGFVARSWLENDGDANAQDKAALLWDTREGVLLQVQALRGKTGARAARDCSDGQWVVLNVDPPYQAKDLPCHLLHPDTLRKSGALALYRSDKGGALRMVSAHAVTGDRLWNTPHLRKTAKRPSRQVAKK
ncbi:MAG: ComEC/Rec2 family competence protein [Roseovarius sp.]